MACGGIIQCDAVGLVIQFAEQIAGMFDDLRSIKVMNFGRKHFAEKTIKEIKKDSRKGGRLRAVLQNKRDFWAEPKAEST